MKKSNSHRADAPGAYVPRASASEIGTSYTGTPNGIAPGPAADTRPSSLLRKISLVIAITMVIARATMVETLREPFGPRSPFAGSHTAGPDVSLILDLLCCLPALLVLLDRAMLKQAIISRSWASILSAGLVIWMAASIFWADDQFAAAITASHWAAAMALLWAFAQLVKTWRDFRPVAAICAGLLLIYLTQAILWRFVEMPLTLETFQKHKAEYFAQFGWEPNSFSARQFEKKVSSLEMLGFNGSSNSFAATIVLLLGVSAGLMLQRLVDGLRQWAILLSLIVPPTFWILFYTHSKAAFITPFLIAIILLTIWRWGSRLNAHRPAAYIAVCGMALFAIASLVLYGLIFHRLPTASLDFRWRYWVAAWQVFLSHPLAGVGWNNFGLHYLRYRLPTAAEEIQDPHNFILRFFTELGIVGGGLGLVWLGRLGWELTVPPAQISEVSPQEIVPPHRIGWIALIAASGLTLNFLAASDLTQFGIIDVMKQALYFCVLLLGTAAASIRPGLEAPLEDRPAPWVLYGILASLGVFLIHNLIEFSLFEIGPMMLFAMLAGIALGICPGRPIVRRKAFNISQLALAAAIFGSAAVFFVLPVCRAESLARQGDDELRADRYADAAAHYIGAFGECTPSNADYLYRAVMATDYTSPNNHAPAKALLDRAIAANPSVIDYYLTRARLNAQMGDFHAMNADYSRALALDPIEVSIHMDYADALAQTRQFESIIAQYESAIHFNDLLPYEEPKRINDGQIRLHYASALLLSGKKPAAIQEARLALVDNQTFAPDDPRRLGADDIKTLQSIIDR